MDLNKGKISMLKKINPRVYIVKGLPLSVLMEINHIHATHLSVVELQDMLEYVATY